MDIRSKLGLYRESSVKKAETPAKTGKDVQDIIDGTVYSNEDGNCYVIENRYPVSYFYGNCRLEDALEASPKSLSRICSDQTGEELSAGSMLFLDTETTGLSGGAGTVAFLVGTGFFEGDYFVIRQLFMRDYDEEPAMLNELNRLLLQYRGLVSFNGRAFDWNLLTGRFISNRIKPALRTPPHIDLLFPSRRIWGHMLESCRLSSLEENILDEKRSGDIPGSMIPAVYFKYLEDRNASDIKQVVRHNELDILSMVSLLTRIAEMLENPLSGAVSQEELLGVGRMFEKTGEEDSVIDCFEYCAKSGSHTVRAAAVKRLSGIYKKSGNYGKAMEHWENLLAASNGFSLYPMIEMAMYYEHKEKNIGKALEIVEKAVEFSIQTGFTASPGFAELRKRQERLKRKAIGTMK